MGLVEGVDWSQQGWDIIIDDGSHLPEHQLVSFTALFPFVRPGGVYVIEDIETSYFDGPSAKIYGYPITNAGLGKPPPGNFVEKMKQLVDVVNRDWFYHPEFSILGPEVDLAICVARTHTHTHTHTNVYDICIHTHTRAHTHTNTHSLSLLGRPCYKRD
jgi:hypothetical protein